MNKRNIIFVLSLITTIAIGYSHYLTGAHISMMLLYAVPILVSAWYCGKWKGIFIALGASASWLTYNAINKMPGESVAILSWDAFTRLGIFTLIAYTVSLQAQLRRALERECVRADTDLLTGLFNKGAFRERVEAEMNRARRYNHPLSLAFIDLDNFKHVNDTFGHAHGDKLLRHVSETIMHTIRNTDIAGRIGGDEFVVCFPEIDEKQVRMAVEKLVASFDIITSQEGWQVTASIGVVTCMEHCKTYDVLLSASDKLMYVSKEKGKNTAQFMNL